LKKLESVSPENQNILRAFHEHMLSKDLKSEDHITNLLVLLISLDKFIYPQPFTSINTNEQILKFLTHRQVDGKWIEREKDAEGKYITTFNQNKRLLVIFFRWLINGYFSRSEDQGDWETPAFMKIKSKRELRDSPYGVNDIWELNEVQTIVAYEPVLRNQAIITLLWDLDARPHEITALRMKDIVLNEQYGEGVIPSNTKTGGGPILLTSSFTYVRDWINRHPFKNDPNARLICNLYTGAAIRPDTIWQILHQLRERIKRLMPYSEQKEKQKLEHLLRTRKFNPYCFRHSAITIDADDLPEHALTKKVRWVMGSRQPKRYIKKRMGNQLKSKILERHGIKIADLGKPQMVSRICGSCGYVNNLGNKYCEAKGCHYPLTQMALDEIKTAEQAKVQKLVNEQMESKNQEIVELKERVEDIQYQLQDLIKKNIVVTNMTHDGRITSVTDGHNRPLD
jgi:integrase/recombinase XerD